jgi:peroxiredoxin family protein
MVTFYDACKSGDTELIKQMMDEGSNNWDVGLQGVCKGGHVNAIKCLFQNKLFAPTNIQQAINIALKEKHIELLVCIINKYNYPACDLLENISHLTTSEKYNLLLSVTINKQPHEWNSMIKCGCKYGNIEIVKCLIKAEIYHCSERFKLVNYQDTINWNTIKNTEDLNIYKLYCLNTDNGKLDKLILLIKLKIYRDRLEDNIDERYYSCDSENSD